MRLRLDSDPPTPADPQPPEGGWRIPDCTFASHHWMLTVEDGHASVACVDPCDDAYHPRLFDPALPTPVCMHEWDPSDFFTPDGIPVALTYVDDSTPSTPAGPAEYSYYIEVTTLKDTAT